MHQLTTRFCCQGLLPGMNRQKDLIAPKLLATLVRGPEDPRLARSRDPSAAPAAYSSSVNFAKQQ